MVKIKKYFRNIVEILKFHDIQPLLLIWMSRFIGGYLLLTIFATIRYLVSLFTDNEAVFDTQTIRALVITVFYFMMWSWIWFKVKREILYKKLLK